MRLPSHRGAPPAMRLCAAATRRARSATHVGRVERSPRCRHLADPSRGPTAVLISGPWSTPSSHLTPQQQKPSHERGISKVLELQAALALALALAWCAPRPSDAPTAAG